MDRSLILEVTDHRGRLLVRTPVPAAGLTVGRGYRNDLILDDPYLDASHLRIVAAPDGAFQFEDLGSLNGVRSSDGAIRLSAGMIGPGTALRAGRSVLRFIDVDQDVAPAIPEAPGPIRSRWSADSPVVGATILVASIGLPMLARYFGSAEDESWSQLAAPGVATLLITGIWATGWAFTNRIVAQRFRFVAHLVWVSAMVLALLATTVAFEWLGFLAPTTDWSQVENIVELAMGATLIAGHFRLLTEWNRRRRWGVAIAVAVTLGTAITVLGNGDGGSELIGDGALKPVTASVIPTSSVDRFFEGAVRLKATIDEE